MDEASNFTLPSSIISQLNEFSYGGFLLFCFDETGAPRFYAQFDNELNMMGLQKSAELWLKGVNDINAMNIKNQLSEPIDDLSEGSEDEEHQDEEWSDLDEEDDFSS